MWFPVSVLCELCPTKVLVGHDKALASREAISTILILFHLPEDFLPWSLTEKKNILLKLKVHRKIQHAGKEGGRNSAVKAEVQTG